MISDIKTDSKSQKPLTNQITIDLVHSRILHGDSIKEMKPWSELESGRSTTGDAAGVSPEIGIIYFIQLQCRILWIMDFGNTERQKFGDFDSILHH